MDAEGADRRFFRIEQSIFAAPHTGMVVRRDLLQKNAATESLRSRPTDQAGLDRADFNLKNGAAPGFPLADDKFNGGNLNAQDRIVSIRGGRRQIRTSLLAPAFVAKNDVAERSKISVSLN